MTMTTTELIQELLFLPAGPSICLRYAGAAMLAVGDVDLRAHRDDEHAVLRRRFGVGILHAMDDDLLRNVERERREDKLAVDIF